MFRVVTCYKAQALASLVNSVQHSSMNVRVLIVATTNLANLKSNIFYPLKLYDNFLFYSFWMMNAEEANKRFYGMNTSTPTTPRGKFRREDVSPESDNSILGKCAVW